jgi:Protein of unknown function (DUF3060)
MDNAHGSSGRLAMAAAAALSVTAVFGIAGCGPKNNSTAPSTGSPTSSTAAPSTTSTGAQFDIGNTINYVSTGTTTTLDCGDGKSLNVGGFNNTLTVRGTCGTVSIGGGDNKITVDKIDKNINVVGSHNAISYKDGEPKVENLGSGNTINKGG